MHVGSPGSRAAGEIAIGIYSIYIYIYMDTYRWITVYRFVGYIQMDIYIYIWIHRWIYTDGYRYMDTYRWIYIYIYIWITVYR